MQSPTNGDQVHVQSPNPNPTEEHGHDDLTNGASATRTPALPASLDPETWQHLLGKYVHMDITLPTMARKCGIPPRELGRILTDMKIPVLSAYRPKRTERRQSALAQRAVEFYEQFQAGVSISEIARRSGVTWDTAKKWIGRHARAHNLPLRESTYSPTPPVRTPANGPAVHDPAAVCTVDAEEAAIYALRMAGESSGMVARLYGKTQADVARITTKFADDYALPRPRELSAYRKFMAHGFRRRQVFSAVADTGGDA